MRPDTPADDASNATPFARFDPDFYRSYYPDLSAFDDEFLGRHFQEHGEREGRLPNRATFFASLSQGREAFPPDFDAKVYRSLYPEVDSFCRSDWDAYRHYAEHGRVEGRRYRELDALFYWQLYLAETPFDRDDIEAHYDAHRHLPDVHASLETLLGKRGHTGRAWIGYFSAFEYSLNHYGRLGKMLNRAQALVSFLDDGLDRGAKFSADVDFDPDFYGGLHPEMRSIGELFRHWVFVGLERREAATRSEWQRQSGFGAPDFPSGFAWRKYAASVRAAQGPILRSKWQALDHLIRHPADDVPVSGWPTPPRTVAEFRAALGGAWLSQNEVRHAIPCLRHAYEAGVRSETLSRHLADANYATGRWTEAWAFYASLSSIPLDDVGLVVRYCECAGRLNRFSAAIGLLKHSKSRHAGDPLWQAAITDTLTRMFEAASHRARTCYAQACRADADAVLISTIKRIETLWIKLSAMPAPTPPASNAPIIMLANLGLRQCTHYRVEQKRQLFRRLGRDFQVFDETDVKGFLGALPGAAGAIFYRVPALPLVVKAIASARLHGVSTYYEVDDLIFDSRFYPDPFESFEGQIGAAAYLELMHGVPLFRAAMAMCDIGIASTSALADHMAQFVRSGTVHVLRNGLDDRNLGVAVPMPRATESGRPVRIFYGSGTLAHNRDFNEALAVPLCDLLTRFQNVELIVMGHLRLDDAFSRFASRITRIPFLDDVRAFWSVLSGCDINLSVLSSSRANDAKSEIKWLEAAILGIPSVLSATATYRERLVDGSDALLVEQHGDWRAPIERLVTHPELRRAIGNAAREKALRLYSLSENAEALSHALPLSPAALKKRPRILIVNVFFPPQAIGGATRVVAGNVDHWIDTGATDRYDVFIATADHKGSPDHNRSLDEYRGIPVFRIAPPQGQHIDWVPQDPQMEEWFASVLDIVKPDLVHFHCIQRLTASCVEACLSAGVRYLVSVHDAWWLSDFQFLVDEGGHLRLPGDEISNGPRRGITLEQSLGRAATLRELLGRADMILAPSDSFAAIYRSEGFRRTRCVSNGVAGSVMVSRKRLLGQRRVVLGHVGNTTAHKGFSLLRATLQQYRFDNLTLIALDHGRSSGDITHATWGATEVEIRGFLDQDRIWDLYAELDVLMAPSIWPESFGLVTREAHAAGLWVVASDRGAIGADVEDGVDGFVIDVSSPEAMARVLQHINDHLDRFRSPPPPKSLRRSQDQAEEILEIYASVLAMKDGPEINR